MLIFKEQLSTDELKKEFEEKYRGLSKNQQEKYKNVHRLYIKAMK